ncbi:hypothetical protein [Okeania sp.]|uniref:hypothetical protein n=1 Tax=Okeania sp. TaxID=3100323 RepID=UPI002B4ACFE1|nr:hypothetical protein [Okeania sp.]MEB3342222.1 hypothetical protein [Okeania sp.]
MQNLALACRICNLRKSNFIHGIDEVTQEQVRYHLFRLSVLCNQPLYRLGYENLKIPLHSL